jgi:hypothetical protein
MSKKRAFVRYTKSGEIVPGSLIITTNGGYPDKSSLWHEVTVDKCCGDIGGGCEKNTLVIPLINMNLISAPYNVLSVEIECKVPEIFTLHSVVNETGFLTLEELISYFNEAKSEQIKLTLISETEIEVEYCKNTFECLYEDAPCFGYTMVIRIDNVVIADVCNV